MYLAQMVWTDGIDWQFTEAGCLASATFQPCLGERDFSMRVFDFVHHYIRFSALYQFQNTCFLHGPFPSSSPLSQLHIVVHLDRCWLGQLHCLHQTSKVSICTTGTERHSAIPVAMPRLCIIDQRNEYYAYSPLGAEMEWRLVITTYYERFCRVRRGDTAANVVEANDSYCPKLHKEE